LIAATQGKGLRIWDVESGDFVLEVPSDGILGEPIMALSSDGRYLAGPVEARKVKVWEVAIGGEAMLIDPGRGYIYNLAFSNGGSRLAIGLQDQNILLWDLQGPGEVLGAAKVEHLWDSLASDDVSRAYGALCALAARGGFAAPFLRERLIVRPPEGRVRKLIADLGQDDIEAREKPSNSTALTRLRIPEDPRKKTARLSRPGCQVDPQRYEAAVQRDTRRLRRIRAISALSRSQAPECVALLRDLSEIATDALVREEAARSLKK
jgi:hypothetical protein